MKVEIIDAKTYVIGDKVFEVGAEIALPKFLQDKLSQIQALDIELRNLRQKAVTLGHEAPFNYSAELSGCAHALNGKSIQYAYLTSSFANELHTHLGGLLPFNFSPDKTKAVVRERSRISDVDFEDVNYTVASVKRMLGMSRMEEQRLIAVRLAGDVKKTRIDFGKTDSYQVQPIEVDLDWKPGDLLGFTSTIVKAVADQLIAKRNPADTLVLASAKQMTGATRMGTSVLRIVPDGTKMRMDGIQRYARETGAYMVGVVSRKGSTVLVAAADSTGHNLTYYITDPTNLSAPEEKFETGGSEAQWKALLVASNVASAR
jgi:hypothetical protein